MIEEIFMRIIYITVIAIWLTIIVICLISVASIIKKIINILLGREEYKVSYGVIIDKSIKTNSENNYILIGDFMHTIPKFSNECTICLEVNKEKFKIIDSNFYKKVNIGNKVIVSYLESKNSIKDLQIIEVIED